eukprot:TRINITY_DN41880_c0_g1_i1.p1 TRINITY_DN41880_c0_g1~~TRINITY_DN41880_c0_g1_i1.p1  ORF type:complete len:258 (+),score=68.08 TRINITY_DN41880_c0_g1_i1:482-1255(+)
MSDEIELCDSELTELAREIQASLDQLPKLEGILKQDKIQFIQDRLSRAKQVFHSFKVELRELDKSEEAQYSAKGKVHNEVIQKLASELQFHKSEVDRNNLMGGRGDYNPDNMSAAQNVLRAQEIQQESKSSLARTINTLDQTQQVATETSEQLVRQTEKLANIHDDVDRVESNLKRADRELRAFIRRLATDKLILFFLLLIVLGVVFMIVWSIVKKDDKNFNVPQDIRLQGGRTGTEGGGEGQQGGDQGNNLVLRFW